ncbi:hypothetical protein ASE99_24380, partial [Serratia sp. Leaf51]
PVALRLEERQRRSKPLLVELKDWLREKVKTLSRHSETAKAFNYALNQWAALAYYCDEGGQKRIIIWRRMRCGR